VFVNYFYKKKNSHPSVQRPI